ncbi:mediator of RNA polymerase II transcription subunit 9-like [Nymphaea colorata]|uniref:mediator of RNA polymerase II transcription subunit 9-like n=1 Tax=Nymphaea colorata TaxID=210225 RepID=UPI00129DA7B2|nr:mediator of RNA polymerase II transcription subunit 9-like [Nymphaea colorata]XP_049934855.1 mediator of RNA polymerase II transcription subunit 9-like [Nymphaea colorata]XP_049934856.1 mediator of RNA polymerase II transcription subunit 9-like [Nymphaea colorata]XP_049934865.1 mediator of RNA polymerase II transcription subunit 9-like [Nymphaea colorata]
MEPQVGGSSLGSWSSIPAGLPNPNIDSTTHQSLASHFHLLPLIDNLAEAVENGTRDQHSDALVAELTSHFERCQQLLNSISGTISSKSATVEGQKRKVDECQQLLNQRRDLISQYKNCVEDLIKSDTKKL